MKELFFLCPRAMQGFEINTLMPLALGVLYSQVSLLEIHTGIS